MALIEINDERDFRIGLWSISETEDELLYRASLNKLERDQFDAMTAKKRRRQWLAVRALLGQMDSNLRQKLTYTPDGAPIFSGDDSRISISHSENVAAVQISAPQHYCGLDIQAGSPKIERLADKFIHPDEWSFIPNQHLAEYLNLIWTMKEAVFKNFTSNLEFKEEIRIAAFNLNADSKVQASVHHNGEKHQLHIHWRRVDEYFLSYLC